MANSLALVWDLIAVDNASGTFTRVGAAADTTAGSVKRLVEGFGALAVGGAIVESAKQAAEFQKQMLLVQTQAGATSQEVANMSPKILALAGQVAQAPEALANSLYHVESTGLRGVKALEAVKVAAEGAKVGNASLEETTNALTALIASGMVPATEDYSQAMGQLNTIVGSGDMKLSDLNDALATGVLVTTKQYGVTLNDVGAALADFGDNNIRGADAATMVRMAVQAIAKPGKDAASALGKVGLTVEQLQKDEQTGGLNKALTDLHTHLVNSGIDASQWGQILVDAFTKKAGGGIINLVGTFDRFQQKYEEVSKGADSFGNAWQQTTKTASFQFSQLKDTVDAVGIKLGTALLKPLGDFAAWLSATGIPAVERFATSVSHVVSAVVNSSAFQTALSAIKTVGSTLLDIAKDITGVVVPAVQSVAKWFGSLPGPIQLAVEGFAALRIAAAAGLFDRLIGSEGSVLSALKNIGAGAVTMANTMRTAYAEAAGAQAALLEEQLGGTAIQRISSSLAGLGAAAGEAASGGLSMLKSAGRGVMNLLGGGFGATLLGASLVVGVLESAISKARDTESKWTDAIKQGGDALAQADVQMAQTQAKYDQLTTGFQGFMDKLLGFGNIINQSTVPQANAAKEAFQKWYDGLDSLQRAQYQVNQDMTKYNDAASQFGPNSHQAAAAADELRAAQEHLATAQGMENDAQKTHLQLLQKQQDAELASVNSGLAAQVAQSELAGALQTYNDDAKDGQHTTAQLRQESLNLAQQIISTAQQTAQAAKDQATANGAADAGIVYNQTLHDTLVKYADTLQGPARQAVLDAIKATGDANIAQHDLSGAIDKLHLNIAQSYPDGTKIVQGATKDQIDALKQLGFTVLTLPGSDPKKPQTIWVTANTSQAYTQLTDFLKQAQALGFVGAIYGLQPLGAPGSSPSGGRQIPGLPPVRANGGIINGPGTGTSDSILARVSNGEFVVKASQTAKHLPLLNAINSGMPGFADGGLVWPAAINPSLVSQWNGALAAARAAAAAAAPSAPTTVLGNAAIVQAMAAARGWTGAEWNALYNLVMRESGFRNTAQNPTSTAYGMFQFLDSTWRSYGLGKTSDPRAQTRAGLDYIASRYGDPLRAWAHETGYGWYKDGTNWVPNDGPAYLHRGEAVVPASKNQGAPYQDQPAVFHLYDSDNVLIGTIRGHAEDVTVGALTAAANRGGYNG